MARASNTSAVRLLFLAATAAVGANPDASVGDGDTNTFVKPLDPDVVKEISVDQYAAVGGMALKPSDKEVKARRNVKEIRQEAKKVNPRTSNDRSGRINKKKNRSRPNLKKVERVLSNGESFQSAIAASFVENSVSDSSNTDSSTMVVRGSSWSTGWNTGWNTGWQDSWQDPWSGNTGWYEGGSKSSKVSKVGSWEGDDWYYDDWIGDSWNGDDWLGKSDKASTDDWWQGDDYHNDWDTGWGNDNDWNNGWNKRKDNDWNNDWKKGSDWGSWGKDKDWNNGWGKDRSWGNGGGKWGGKWNDWWTFPPTLSPTMSPTFYPTFYPTISPTYTPTSSPTWTPTWTPTVSPTISDPTFQPTNSPTMYPTVYPTASPTAYPTISPTILPTINPTTLEPTGYPTMSPTQCTLEAQRDCCMSGSRPECIQLGCDIKLCQCTRTFAKDICCSTGLSGKQEGKCLSMLDCDITKCKQIGKIS